MLASQYGMLEVVEALLRFHARVDVFDEVIEAHLATKIIQIKICQLYKCFDCSSVNCSSLVIINFSRIIKDP